MAYVSVDIPAGIFKHGTDLDSVGRWRDANLIRWQNGSVRPVGGWTTRKASAFTYAPRGAITWTDNSADAHIAAGTYEKLYHVNKVGTVSDITPTSFTTGDLNADQNLGYGGSFYGTSYYSTERPSDGVPEEATSWSMDTWGQYLIACSSKDGKIYEWQLNTGTPAAAITNAPVGNGAIVVTEERFIFALGAGSNPRLVKWCDREDNTDWTPTAINQAGDLELQTSGEIMCGIRVRGRTLILTSLDAHVATYNGPPTVYGFERVGTSCGTISRMAAVAVDEGAFWMGSKSFFTYNGSSVQEMPCDVSDHVFKDINHAQKSKAFAVNNSQFGEVWWFYPSSASLENDRYVVFDYKEGHWNIGELSRSSAVDAGVFSNPIMFDTAGNVLNHETGYAHNGSETFLESGPISIAQGDQIAKVNEIIPDELNQGEVTLTFKTRFYPNDSEVSHGPFALANPTGARFSGRQVRMRINGTELKDWRAGKMRLNVIPGGKR